MTKAVFERVIGSYYYMYVTKFCSIALKNIFWVKFVLYEFFKTLDLIHFGSERI